MEEIENARMIFKGKIIDLEREIKDGFNFGTIEIDGFDSFHDNTMTINF